LGLLTPLHTGIVFDRVVTNIGAAYDPQSGRFTSPIRQSRGYLPRRSAYDAQSGRFTSPINATYQFNVVISAQGRQKVSHMEQSPLWSITQKPPSEFSKIACIGWKIFTNSL